MKFSLSQKKDLDDLIIGSGLNPTSFQFRKSRGKIYIEEISQKTVFTFFKRTHDESKNSNGVIQSQTYFEISTNNLQEIKHDWIQVLESFEKWGSLIKINSN